MNDNVVEFGKAKKEEPAPPTADEVLKEALGKYDQVIIIGANDERVAVASTMSVEEALFMMHRAVHKLNLYLDRG